MLRKPLHAPTQHSHHLPAAPDRGSAADHIPHCASARDTLSRARQCRSTASTPPPSKRHTTQPSPSLEDGESAERRTARLCPKSLTPLSPRFLLKYASRDSVELLGRGKGGVHEARFAIARYPDQSPLYGLLIYRRRKVLIKYIPEGTSRLLQGSSTLSLSRASTPRPLH